MLDPAFSFLIFMPSVLITGASGFIGSFLVEEGLRRGFTVYAVVRSTSSRKWLTDPRIHLLEMEMLSEAAISRDLSSWRDAGLRFDFIIHNAGVTKVNRVADFARINRDLTIAFVNALRATGLIPDKFLFMSSLAAWGPGNPVTMEPVRPTDLPRPTGMYGKSKWEAEEFIRHQPDLPYIIFRPTGVYGPREQDYLKLYNLVQSGWEFFLGSRAQELSFIYVRDLARFAYEGLLSGKSRKEYFVSDGCGYTVQEFSMIVKSILHKKTIAVTVPLPFVRILAFILEKACLIGRTIPLIDRDRYLIYSQLNWKCDASLLFSDLDCKPEYVLRKGLEETLMYRQEGLV